MKRCHSVSFAVTRNLILALAHKLCNAVPGSAASLRLCFNLKLRARRDGSNGEIQRPEEKAPASGPCGWFPS